MGDGGNDIVPKMPTSNMMQILGKAKHFQFYYFLSILFINREKSILWFEEVKHGSLKRGVWRLVLYMNIAKTHQKVVFCWNKGNIMFLPKCIIFCKTGKKDNDVEKYVRSFSHISRWKLQFITHFSNWLVYWALY